jgi:SNF2-related domain
MSAVSPSSLPPSTTLRISSDTGTKFLEMPRAVSCGSAEMGTLVNSRSSDSGPDAEQRRPDPKEVADAWAELRASGITSQCVHAKRPRSAGSSFNGPEIPPELRSEDPEAASVPSRDVEESGPGLGPDSSCGGADDERDEIAIGDDSFAELYLTALPQQPDFGPKLDALVVNLDENEDDLVSAHTRPDFVPVPMYSGEEIQGLTANETMQHALLREDDRMLSHYFSAYSGPGSTGGHEIVIDVDDPDTDVRVAHAARIFSESKAHCPVGPALRPVPHDLTPVPVVTVEDEVVCVPSDDDDGWVGIPDVRDNVRLATAGEVFGGGGVYTDLRQTSLARNGLHGDGEYDRGAIKKLVEFNNLSADATEEIESPPELAVQLLRHQKRAVAWMLKREQLGTSAVVDSSADVNLTDADGDEDEMDGVGSDLTEMCRGGILADEQGLGKTLSIITLFLVNPPRQIGLEPPKWRTLVICPVSLVGQWKEEIENRLRKEHRRSVYVYHGPKRTRSASELASYDVVISTYTTTTNEYPKLLRDDPRYAIAKKAKTTLPRRQGGPLFQCRWYRVVLDEAHNIKNRRTECWAAANQLVAEQRWCLTGTPIQNSVDDIYSLFCFIRFRFMAVNNYKTWNETWKKKLESTSPHVRERSFRRFQAIVGVVTLRRTKKDTIDGKPLITIPDRICDVREVAFSTPREMAFYKAVEKNSIVELGKFISAGGLRQHYSGIMVLLLRMRQACCHPSLIEYTAAKSSLSDEDDTDFYSPYNVSELNDTQQLMEAGESSFAALPELSPQGSSGWKCRLQVVRFQIT